MRITLGWTEVTSTLPQGSQLVLLLNAEPALNLIHALELQGNRAGFLESVSHGLPIPVGDILPVESLALWCNRHGRCHGGGSLPAPTCKMSLLWDAPPVAKIFVLGTAREKKNEMSLAISSKQKGCSLVLQSQRACVVEPPWKVLI
jgi:hypothetical protein